MSHTDSTISFSFSTTSSTNPVVAAVSLNPSIDKTVLLDELVPGELNRVRSVRMDPGGKGINVALALKNLGLDVVLLACMAGDVGHYIQNELLARGIPVKCMWTRGNTRTNMKVIEAKAGRLTEINEPGPLLEHRDVDGIRTRIIRMASKREFVVFSGSLPPGAPDGMYREMISALNGRGIKTVLDADGEALRLGLEARPYMIKVNRVEVEGLLGVSVPSPREAGVAAGLLIGRGCRIAIISLGPEGAVLGLPEGVCWAKSRPIEVRSPVGCGDALVAATIFGLRRGFCAFELARFAVAAATAAALKEGTAFPTEDEVREQLGRVEVIESEVRLDHTLQILT